MGAAWVESLPVARFHGVGPVTAAKMERLGIVTGADLRAKSLDFLRENFGSSAEWYYGIARGIDHRRVNPDRERKSSGSETTFDRDLDSEPEIVAGVLSQADEVWAWCDKAQAFGRTVTVKVKFADFQTITRSKSQPRSVDTQEDLRAVSEALIRSVLPAAKGIRLVGVTVSNFDQPAKAIDDILPLFDAAVPVA